MNAFFISQETRKNHPSTCIASNKNFENFRKSANNFGLKVRKDFQNEFLGRLWSRVWKNFNFEIIFRLSTKVQTVISLWNTNRTFETKFWYLFPWIRQKGVSFGFCQNNSILVQIEKWVIVETIIFPFPFFCANSKREFWKAQANKLFEIKTRWKMFHNLQKTKRLSLKRWRLSKKM